MLKTFDVSSKRFLNGATRDQIITTQKGDKEKKSEQINGNLLLYRFTEHFDDVTPSAARGRAPAAKSLIDLKPNLFTVITQRCTKLTKQLEQIKLFIRLYEYLDQFFTAL